MSQRSVNLNGALVRLLREARGLNIGEAAHKAGIGENTWFRFEQGKQGGFRKNAKAVADLLGVQLETLVLEPSRGLSADFRLFGTTGFASALVPIARKSVRASLQEALLAFIVVLDMAGDFVAAEATCRALCAVVVDRKQHVVALTRLAAIEEHLGKRREALENLRRALRLARQMRVLDSQICGWVRYQLAVTYIADQRLERARTLLAKLEDNSDSEPALQTSARHQLGVIALRRGRYRQAEQWLKASLAGRQSASYRRAFDLSGLAEVYAQTGRRPEAKRAIRDAWTIVRASGLTRYETKIKGVADLIDPTLFSSLLRRQGGSRIQASDAHGKPATG